MNFHYDIIVIGAGHAGCEAAVAAARLGASTLLITADLNRVAQMSCNPAVGGIAKGQIVREIDALGGQMGIVADRTAIQFRMLNRSKGPAVWSPRVQSDRTKFIDEWRRILDSTPNLELFQGMAVEFILDPIEPSENEGRKWRISGVKTDLGMAFFAKKIILTAGTFLSGLMHFGPSKVAGGRISEPASFGLSEQLKSIGFEVGRMKTGTPARISGKSIDFSLCQRQDGDDAPSAAGLAAGASPSIPASRDPHKFSFLPWIQRELPIRPCYITHTNEETHTILSDNLSDSPLYNGDIQSIGPRYCPSIETKIVTFPDKDSHQLFLEPEGETTDEYYINGFSSSLPWRVQLESLQQIPALRNIHFYRPGYAIEYDYFPPTQLTHDLQTKLVAGLYFAGQVNGTTGYEEAAAQGLMAGINAARSLKGESTFILGRDEAYIGVLIDDLVTKGVDEPYRMFTSRAEFRILLRQDDADMRLTPRGYAIGLASKERYEIMQLKKEKRDALIEFLKKEKVSPTPAVNAWLESLGSAPLTAGTHLIDLLKRPQISLQDLIKISPRLNSILESALPVGPVVPARPPEDECERAVVPLSPRAAHRLGAPLSEIAAPRPSAEQLKLEIIEAAEILVKYDGYIVRERDLAEKLHRLEDVRIPDSIAYEEIKALSTEARQKLARIRPRTIGQASRIPGVSPADTNVLLILLRN